MYAKNVRSDARWSRATLPEFSRRNSTHFSTSQRGSDLEKRFRWLPFFEHLHCKFSESELASFCSSVSDDNIEPAEKGRLQIGDREDDGLLSS